MPAAQTLNSKQNYGGSNEKTTPQVVLLLLADPGCWNI
jgi:hypothetical protein